jgi:hypothetical protein
VRLGSNRFTSAVRSSAIQCAAERGDAVDIDTGLVLEISRIIAVTVDAGTLCVEDWGDDKNELCGKKETGLERHHACKEYCVDRRTRERRKMSMRTEGNQHLVNRRL